MNNLLLTTTAIVAISGAAAADGHVSIGWSGTATAGVAREGGTDATGQATDALISVLTAAEFPADVQLNAINELAEELLDNFRADSEDELAVQVADARSELADRIAELESEVEAGTANDRDKARLKRLAGVSATMDAFFGTLATDTKDFDTYAEINATVTGSVATDNGLTLSASMSVDAGMGYDFADDDGFDSAKTNGVGFDHVTLDAGTFGTLKFAPDDIAHLVDDDDDASVDVLYTNDFGVAKVSFALDIDTDSDVEASATTWAFSDDVTSADAIKFYDRGANESFAAATDVDGDNDEDVLTYTPANAADVQWSAKVEAPVADIATVYAAFDEEGGYDIGGSAIVAGVTLNAKAKSEALAVAEDDDTEFEVGAEYTASGLTVGATWNSIEDDNQWGISGAYTMGAFSIAASTDEGEDWEVTGAYDLGSGASLEAGVNYTEDAYVGVSFSF